jgi:LPXTG-motif cell wall-anchored protein
LFAWVGAAVALSAIGILASRRKKPSRVAERRG